jgi:TonB family protein
MAARHRMITVWQFPRRRVQFMSKIGVLFALLGLAASGSVVAQTHNVLIDEARELYIAAAYEQALSVLDRVDVPSASDAATVELYRAACLLVLDRADEAERAFERLVTLAPDLRPDQLGMAPRITSRFATVRARVLPGITQQRQAQDRAEGTPVAIWEQPAFHTVDDVSVSRPIPLRERVPEPPAVKGIDFTGTVTLQVDIATDGSVERVSLEGTIHPIYDSMILEAAKMWRYQPATLDGQPVKFRKALKIEIS